ncbi:ABC transporter permease [Clostridium polyendosporum]|uniref:ABC transporter permease n=1 Tax=Clostridium polyendosporum TaxID=69208 RepID=A0A919S0M8_9CLOT|nr:ABC transporter permease [Clostridium polyendosporum]GIM29781.1 ABC transporter permease [Clostridium polyendosporum]
MSLNSLKVSINKTRFNKNSLLNFSIVKDIFIPLIAPVILLIIWELLGENGIIRSSILPAPSVIGIALLDMLRTGELIEHLTISIIRVFEGFCLGAFLGISFGVAIGLFKGAEKALNLIIGILRPIPIVAWVPVLILWMGIDEASKITVIAIGSFWPILLNTIHGIKNTDKKYIEVAEILEKNKINVLTKVVLPSALPSIFTGLRIGIGTAWMSVIAAEIIAASSGIGYKIAYARELSQPDIMLVGVFSIGIVGILIDVIIKKLEFSIVKWNVNNRS